MSTTGPEPGSGPTDTDTASRRRSSFAEMFSRQPAIDIAAANGGRTNAMAIAMQQQQQHEQRSRRLSVSALGLSGSPTRISPSASAFETLRDKSMGARPRAASTAVDENAVDDAEPVAPLSSDAGSRPTSPSVGRRLSFGAMAYRDQMRSASGGSDMSLSPEGSGGTGGGGASPPPSARRGWWPPFPHRLEESRANSVTQRDSTGRKICAIVRSARRPRSARARLSSHSRLAQAGARRAWQSPRQDRLLSHPRQRRPRHRITSRRGSSKGISTWTSRGQQDLV